MAQVLLPILRLSKQAKSTPTGKLFCPAELDTTVCGEPGIFCMYRLIVYACFIYVQYLFLFLTGTWKIM